MSSQRALDELYVKQITLYTDATGKEVRAREEKKFTVPQATGNMNSKADHINFFLYKPLTLTSDGKTENGITATLKTYLTYRVGKTKNKDQTRYPDREVVLTHFNMQEHADPSLYAYTATYYSS